MNKFRNKKQAAIFIAITMALAFFIQKKIPHPQQADSITDSSSLSITKENRSQTPPSSPIKNIYSHTTTLKRGPNNRLILHEAIERPLQAPRGTDFEDNIFKRIPPDKMGPLTINEHTLSAIEVLMDPIAVQEIIASGSSSFKLPLTADQDVKATVDKVISRGEYTHTLTGTVDDDPLSAFLFVFHDGVVNGSISFYESNTHYEYVMAGNGNVAIRQMNPATYIERCGEPDAVADAIDTKENLDTISADAVITAMPPAGAIRMDSVVGYSKAARIAEGGVAPIEARIIASIDRMNGAFVDSHAGKAFASLLAIIEDPDYIFPGTSGESMNDELYALKTHGDGVLDTISQLRIDLGADHNSFVQKEADGSAGLAYLDGNSMIVARTYMSQSKITFAHEFGHSIGCHHAWGDSTSDGKKAQNNYGWRMQTATAKYGTIMAYDSDWSRIPYFSNTNTLYNGVRMGAVDGYDVRGDPTADPRFAIGGYGGDGGYGFTGDYPRLGARNAECISQQASILAARDTRTALSVLDPAAGVVWNPGTTNTLFWYGGDHTDSVTAELYNNGVFQYQITTIPSAASRWHEWIIPNTQAYSTNYTVRIILNGTLADDSDAFTIGQPIVELMDTDNDGINDFLEDAFGTDINKPDEITFLTRGTSGDMNYTVRNLKTGYTYTIQTNQYLTGNSGWADYKVLQGLTGGDPTVTPLPFSLIGPSNQSVFIRLKVSN